MLGQCDKAGPLFTQPLRKPEQIRLGCLVAARGTGDRLAGQVTRRLVRFNCLRITRQEAQDIEARQLFGEEVLIPTRYQLVTHHIESFYSKIVSQRLYGTRCLDASPAWLDNDDESIDRACGSSPQVLDASLHVQDQDLIPAKE